MQVERMEEWYEWYHRSVLKMERDPETGELVDIVEDEDEAQAEMEDDFSFQHQEMQELIRTLGENQNPLIEHMYHTLPIFYRCAQASTAAL